MLVLFIALQLTTTHCSPDYAGGVTCTTNTPQANLPAAPDYYGQFLRAQRQQTTSVVGQMIARGECNQALSYALQNGDSVLAENIRVYCR